MTITDILSISIVGSFMSLVIQFIKIKSGANKDLTKAMTIIFSLIVGAIFYFFSETEFFTAALGVLGVASTVWAFVLKDSTVFSLPSKSKR